MVHLYFDILPYDLIYQLSLYFGQNNINAICSALKCNLLYVYLYKIRYELGYSNDFIRNYVYDTQNNVPKTLLPINEKYLELKARTEVDFGTEIFTDLNVSIQRSSRLHNPEEAEELTRYFLAMITVSDRYYYGLAVEGFMSTGNVELAKSLMSEYHNSGYDYRGFRDSLITGVYERYPNGNSELLQQFYIGTPAITDYPVIRGLAQGGHLDRLKTIAVPNIRWLFNAIKFNRINIINHYDLLKHLLPSDIDIYIVDFGHIGLLDHYEEHVRVKHLMYGGYIEEVEKYDVNLMQDNILLAKSNCVKFNHLDMLDYMYKNFPLEFRYKIKINVSTTLPVVYKYLRDRDLIAK